MPATSPVKLLSAFEMWPAQLTCYLSIKYTSDIENSKKKKKKNFKFFFFNHLLHVEMETEMATHSSVLAWEIP